MASDSRLFGIEEHTDPTFFWGRVLLFLFLAGWGVRFLAGGPDAPVVLESFMHNVNLPIHEAGHIVFGFFGEMIGIMGGSLMQLLMPALFVAAFLYQRNPFAAAAGLWWLGQNFMDLAPYIGDARAQRLILIGGITGRDLPGFHDWNAILGYYNLIEHDQLLAQVSYDIGRMLMVAFLAWGGWLLLLQFRRLPGRSGAPPPPTPPATG
jgi:hypothetical protein